MSIIDSNPFVHPTAIVDKGAYIGNFTKIWHWTHISSEAKIGENCTLGQNVFIGNKVTIGNNVKVQNNVSIYDMVSIEDDVFCGPSVVFTNVYNPRSKINRKNEYQKTLIKKGASIGANATIICGNTIGSFAFIGAGAVVNKDVKPYSLLVGVPAKQIGWISSYGERIKLPLIGEGEWECKKTGEVYILEFNQIKLKT
ncbi:MAG: N-acetyltransferase [Prochlorococcus marinus CUG1435]|nr:N-acetyltransferase [Prochlorococcus marinus CUG1435]